MIPVEVARAAEILWEIGLPTPKDEVALSIPLRVTTEAGSAAMCIETACRCAALKIIYDDPTYTSDEFDILISHKSVSRFVETSDPDELQFSDFGDDKNWRDIDTALSEKGGEEVKNPRGFELWSSVGLDLTRLRLALSIFEVLYEDLDNVTVRVSSGKDPLNVVSLYVPITSEGKDVQVFLMPVKVTE
jgi:hypothetical protein